MRARALACAVLLAAGLAGGAAGEPRLVVLDGGGIADFLDGLAEAALLEDRLCAELEAELAPFPGEASLRLDLAQGIVAFSGSEAGSERLRRWAQAARGALATYRRLGGSLAGGAVAVRLSSDGIFVAGEGKGGRLFADPCEALGAVLALIAATGGGALAGAAEAAPDPGEVFARLLAAAREGASRRATLAQGSEARIALEGAPAGELPGLAGTAGIAIAGIARDEAGRLVATVRVPATTPTGVHAIYEYAPGSRFEPVRRHEVAVVPGRGAAPLPARAPVSLAVGSGAAGELYGEGDVVSFLLPVDRPGTVELRSAGKADARAVLYGPRGEVVAADDDGGASYNFLIRAAVAPGLYRLDVAHCCGGAGDFLLTTAYGAP